MKKHFSTRMLSLLLAVVMIVSIVPVGMVSSSAAREDVVNNIIRIATSEKQGYIGRPNKYTKWYGKVGNYSYHWCATFVSWVMKEANVSTKVVKKDCGCAPMANQFKQQGVLHSPGNYTPVKGDIVFFTNGKSKYSHVGIVLGYDKSKTKSLHTVEGNTSWGKYNLDCLVTKWRNPNFKSFKVSGYAHPSYSGTTNYKLTANNAEKITNHSAKVSFGVSPKASVKKATLLFAKKSESSELVNVKSSIKVDNLKSTKHYNIYGNSSGKTVSKVEFDTASGTSLGGYKIKFAADTTYKYRFLVVIGNKSYLTDVKEFKTKCELPDKVTNLKVSEEFKEIGLGATASATWKAPAKAEKYEVTVKDSANKTIQIKTVTKGTAFTTEKINNADTYTISVVAINDSGRSAAVTTNFKVNNNLTVLFDYGNGRSEKRTVNFNGTVTAPEAPKKDGYSFEKWKNAEGLTVKASAKINNVKTSTTYTAQFKAEQYSVRIVDGISNKVIKSQKVDYGTTINVPDFLGDTTIPTHRGYTFEGYSEETYVVDSETHNIYLRYKWSSNNRITSEITSIERAKSNANLSETDGYSVDIKVIVPATDDTSVIRGRAIIALKTANGRLIVETESSAFVMYPSNSQQVTKSIEVFVPYVAGEHDGLPSLVETYIVNNYTSAGIISDVVTDTTAIAYTNENTWQYSTTQPTVGVNGVTEVNPLKDFIKYDYTVTTETTKQALEPTLKGYTYTGQSAWHQVETGNIKYVNSWPTLGNDLGCKYNNTSGVGKVLYNRYNNKSELKTAVTTETSKIETSIKSGTDHIYYHWCRNATHDKSKMNYNITSSKCYGSQNTSNYYKQFHAFWLHTENGETLDYLKTDFGSKMYRRVLHKDRTDLTPSDYRDICNDSWWWCSDRVPINTQTWTKSTRYFTHKKIETETGSTTNLSDVPSDFGPTTTSQTIENVPLLTTVKKTVTKTSTKYYAYKTSVNPLGDANIYDINGKVDDAYATKEAVVYVYKNNQVSDSNTEYIGATTIGENGVISIPGAQLREACTKLTGDFTIAVALENEENAMIAGTIEVPDEEKQKYNVTFVATVNDSDGENNIQTETVSTQEVIEGHDAQIPEESLIPEKKGYHFVAWNNTATNINNDLIVEAVYEPDDYSVVYVDWNTKSIDIQHYKYGQVLNPIEIPELEDDMTAEWVIENNNGNTQTVDEFMLSNGVVTSDMVVSLQYSTKECEVTILDNDGNETLESDDSMTVLTQKKVQYGDTVQLDEVEDTITDSENVIFSGWKNAATNEYIDTIEIKEDITLVPVYQFADTVDMPIASVTTGEYDEAQIVELTTETENATIFYTTDGSDPVTSATAVEYTAPITISKSCQLQFCASALGMNNSGTTYELYAINSPENTVHYHIVNVYSNLPQQEGEMYQTLIKDSTLFKDDDINNLVGYNYNGLYIDEEYTEAFDCAAELITESINLYADYEAKLYTVTFYDEDGTTVISKQQVEYANEPEIPAPEKEGFVFVGWDKEIVGVSEDVSYTARYVPEEEYARVSITAKKAVMKGASIQLKVTITPAELEGTTLSWDSDDGSVASVDADGVVTAIGVGTTTITVTVDATGESAECVVTVSANPDLEIVLAKNSKLDIFDSCLRRIPDKANSVDTLAENFLNEDLIFTDKSGNVLSESALLGTGGKVTLKDGEEILDEITAIMTGDYDGNGIINNRDVAMLNNLLVEKITADEYQILAVDVNGDGAVNNRDAAILARYLVGKEVIE